MSDEDRISRRYRELPREEPPRALDDAILSAARRAAQSRPAPLVVPSGRSRWYFPLAAAAVIVLAVAVTVHVQREQPDAETVLGTAMMRGALETPPPPAEQPEPASQPAPASKLEAFTPDPKRRAAPESRAAARMPESRERQAALPAPAEAPRAPAPPSAAQMYQEKAKRDDTALRDAVDAASRDAERAAAEAKVVDQARMQPAPAASVAAAPKPGPRREAAQMALQAGAFTPHSPEQWLQGIADLRRQGRHAEADKSLAEFRRRHPDYKISEAILEKVERSR